MNIKREAEPVQQAGNGGGGRSRKYLCVFLCKCMCIFEAMQSEEEQGKPHDEKGQDEEGRYQKLVRRLSLSLA